LTFSEYNSKDITRTINEKNFSIYTTRINATPPITARVTCSQFNNYQDAKNYLDAKKPGYKSLDRNHNGIPCEQLYKTAFKKNQAKTRIRIYKYGSPSSYGSTYLTMDKCINAKNKLSKSNAGSDYTYKCEKL